MCYSNVFRPESDAKSWNYLYCFHNSFKSTIKTYYSLQIFTMNFYLNEPYYECIMWDLSMYPFQRSLFDLTCEKT